VYIIALWISGRTTLAVADLPIDWGKSIFISQQLFAVSRGERADSICFFLVVNWIVGVLLIDQVNFLV
jgi:hypothetical protein